MKKIASLLFFLVFLAASVAAVSAASKGCNLQGSWMGFDPLGPAWMASVHGQSSSSGTNELVYPFVLPKLPMSFEPPYNYVFPDAVGMTSLRGEWERTGGNTFDYTFLGYAYDESGIPIYAAKVIGDIILNEDCNSGDFGAITEVYVCPACNPFTDTPYTVIPWPTTTGYRVTIE